MPASDTIKAANAGDPLAVRIGGYDVGDTRSYWEVLSAKAALASERLLLVADLAFPLVYGGAFAMAFVTSWMMLGRPLHIGWLLAPVVIVVAADWTENLVLLAQLDAFETNRDWLSTGWIRVASLATTIKLAAVAVCSILTLALAFCLVGQA